MQKQKVTTEREEAKEANYEPLSLLTFLLRVAAAVGVLMVFLHMLSKLFGE